jgi:hypothetical protein
MAHTGTRKVATVLVLPEQDEAILYCHGRYKYLGCLRFSVIGRGAPCPDTRQRDAGVALALYYRELAREIEQLWRKRRSLPRTGPPRVDRRLGRSNRCQEPDAGTVNRKIDPPSGLGSAHRLPPCASMMARHNESPTPIP